MGNFEETLIGKTVTANQKTQNLTISELLENIRTVEEKIICIGNRYNEIKFILDSTDIKGKIEQIKELQKEIMQMNESKSQLDSEIKILKNQIKEKIKRSKEIENICNFRDPKFGLKSDSAVFWQVFSNYFIQD